MAWLPCLLVAVARNRLLELLGENRDDRHEQPTRRQRRQHRLLAARAGRERLKGAVHAYVRASVVIAERGVRAANPKHGSTVVLCHAPMAGASGDPPGGTAVLRQYGIFN